MRVCVCVCSCIRQRQREIYSCARTTAEKEEPRCCSIVVKARLAPPTPASQQPPSLRDRDFEISTIDLYDSPRTTGSVPGPATAAHTPTRLPCHREGNVRWRRLREGSGYFGHSSETHSSGGVTSGSRN